MAQDIWHDFSNTKSTECIGIGSGGIIICKQNIKVLYCNDAYRKFQSDN